MARRRSIRFHLNFLVLTAALPLASLGAYEVFVDATEEIRRIEAEALRMARITAADTERLLAETEWLLKSLSTRPRMRAPKADDCDPVFGEVRDLHPRYFNLALFDRNGIVTCSAQPTPRLGKRPPDSAFEVVVRARRERKMIIGSPFRSATTASWVSLVTLPVVDDGGEITAVLGLAVDLVKFHPIASATVADLLENSHLAIVDRDGTLIARSRDPETMVGSNVRQVPAMRDVLALRYGVLHGEDKDGVKRIYGIYPVNGTDWLAVAALPTEQATSKAWRVALEHSAFLLMGLAAGLFLAWLIARRINQPIEQIALAARAIEQGDISLRAPVGGALEVAEVAAQFNHTLDSLAAERRALVEFNATLEQRVAERTAELESFSYSVSHDLRAPLRAINGYARILETELGGSLEAEKRKLLDRIAENAVRMGELIDDLLQFSHAGRDEMNRQDVDLAALSRGVADELHELFPAASLTIGDLPAVSCDPPMLRQVFANLIGNALKFSGKRPDARVDIGVQARDGETAFFVRDNGAGFDMRYADRMFGVFQRMHKASEFPGTGVGLAIVKRIVERHGGRVWAESMPGEGATFFFTLAGRAESPDRPA